MTVQGGKFYAPLELAAKDIISSNQDRVGLKLGFDDPEYSIWIMLQYRGFTGRLDHILVNNESARIPAAGPAPRVVIASITNVAAALTNMFPYECHYGLVRTFWSEPASHWSELAQCDSTGEKHRLPPQNAPAIPFGNESIDLYLRTPRSGTLHLAGFVMDAGGKPVGDNSMRITTDSGFDQLLALQGQSFSARISSVGGTCKMTLTLVNARSNHAEPRLEKLQWRWETEENASSPNRPE